MDMTFDPGSFQNIEFELGKYELMPGSERMLDKVAGILVRFPRAQFVITGHTDNTGTTNANLVLSRKRAEAVRDHLVKRHRIDASRIQCVGMGPLKPVTSNQTKEGRMKNRRIEIEIVNP
jgi:OOP family OmpA-OmpF porin